MSRLDEDLARDFSVIAERVTPSPTAWEEIQQRIADREPTTETEIIMLTDNTTRTRRWPLVAAAAAVAAIAIGAIALVNRDDGAEQPADVPDPVPTVAPAPDTDATPLPAEGLPVAPGRYAVDQLGTPVEFDLSASDADWTVGLNNPLAFTVTTETGFWGMQRIGSFLDADQAQDADVPGLGTISPANVDGWIEANGMIVDASSETSVAGRTAQFRQVRVPPGSGTDLCPTDEQPCIRVNSVSADLIGANPGEGSRIGGQFANAYWFIELDDFEPIGIWAYAFDGDTEAWLDEIAPVIESITLGEPAPAVEGGTARLSTFGADPSDIALPAVGEQVEPGVYTSTAIGTPFTVELGEGATAPWTVISNDENGVQLWSDDTAREFVTVGRIGSWMNFDEARDEQTRGPGSIPADDIDGWIAANGIIVVDSEDVEIGGRPAMYRRIRLDTTPGATADWCPRGEAPCLWAANGSADLIAADQTPVPFARDRLHTIWLVDMGEFEPVVILAIPNLDDEEAWFDEIVQPIVDSISFGAPAPVVEGGTARVRERVETTASITGDRIEGAANDDGTFPVTTAATADGDLVGTITSTGVRTGNQVIDELVFTGSIDGVGSGTLTFDAVTTIGLFGDVSVDMVVVDGTEDFAGLTGAGEWTNLDAPESTGPFTAQVDLRLGMPPG